nr:uncharacterized protein LOC112941345 isoform X2 [Solanum lycopersicum]
MNFSPCSLLEIELQLLNFFVFFQFEVKINLEATMGSSEVSLQKFVHAFKLESHVGCNSIFSTHISSLLQFSFFTDNQKSGIWSILEESLLKIAIYNNFIQDIAIY